MGGLGAAPCPPSKSGGKRAVIRKVWPAWRRGTCPRSQHFCQTCAKGNCSPGWVPQGSVYRGPSFTVPFPDRRGRAEKGDTLQPLVHPPSDPCPLAEALGERRSGLPPCTPFTQNLNSSFNFCGPDDEQESPFEETFFPKLQRKRFLPFLQSHVKFRKGKFPQIKPCRAGMKTGLLPESLGEGPLAAPQWLERLSGCGYPRHWIETVWRTPSCSLAAEWAESRGPGLCRTLESRVVYKTRRVLFGKRARRVVGR